MPIQRPRCRFCGRPWRPPEGVVAAKAYCTVCSDERRALAAAALEIRPPTDADVDGDYLVMRKRATR